LGAQLFEPADAGTINITGQRQRADYFGGELKYWGKSGDVG
jgi:hypothetical protein